MWEDPYTRRSAQDGYDCCDSHGSTCYTVQFYILPSKLVRKRHRDRKQTAIYCSDCYEMDGDLPILLNGQRVGLRKNGIGDTFDESHPFICLNCRRSFLAISNLYGSVTSSLWMSGSCIENFLLAVICSECLENTTITLLKKINN